MSGGPVGTGRLASTFDGARLTFARQLAGLRKSDLARQVDRTATAVAGWESGVKRPSRAVVAQLCLVLAVDPAFFAGRTDGAAELPTPHFRSLRSTPQLARDQAAAYGRAVADVAAALERHVELPPVSLPVSPVSPISQISPAAGHGDDPELAAQLLRRSWSTGPGPVGHLIRLAEVHGVLVVFSPLYAATVDAYSFDAGSRPVVVLNPTTRDPYRQRFDVAHELGHLVMHADAEPGGRVVEDQADRFAAELLMPADEIRALLPATMGGRVWADLRTLKEHWGVSMQALLYRARRLGVLGEVSYRNAMTTISARGWRRAEPGSTTVAEQPSLLARSVELLAAEGVDADLLASRCGLPRRLFDQATLRFPPEVDPEVAVPPGFPPGAVTPGSAHPEEAAALWLLPAALHAPPPLTDGPSSRAHRRAEPSASGGLTGNVAETVETPPLFDV